MSNSIPTAPLTQERGAPRLDTESFASVSAGRDIFFAAVETTRMPMIITDPRQPDNPIVFANEAFLQLTGYTVEEMLGRNCRFLQGPETDPATVAALRTAIQEQREISTEILNYRKDGSSFWNALFVSPVRNRAGELIYFFASQLDVSRRRDAEDALRQAQKMEALGQLTGGIAHDFNNLLQVMMGHAAVASKRAENVGYTDPLILKSLEGIRNVASKAGGLTQQLLAFARKQQLQGRVINFNGLAESLSDVTRRTLGDQIQLSTKLQPGLWNCRVDPTQAEVALLNVLLNARDALPQGGRVTITTANIEITPEALPSYRVPTAGAYVTVAITDNGHGIPAPVLSRVMDPFFTTKAEDGGTGLGLSMVYGFAKQSGGAATIYSEVGTGTTVRLYFPATEDAVRPSETRASSNTYEGTEKILIVDDRSEVAEMTHLMLSSIGYDTQWCTSASEALNRLRTNEHFDLLLSDLIMPGGINGVMLAQQARKLRPGLRVLLTTGFADTVMQHAGEEHFELIFKPYGQIELARRVRAVIDYSAAEPKKNDAMACGDAA